MLSGDSNDAPFLWSGSIRVKTMGLASSLNIIVFPVAFSVIGSVDTTSLMAMSACGVLWMCFGVHTDGPLLGSSWDWKFMGCAPSEGTPLSLDLLFDMQFHQSEMVSLCVKGVTCMF